MLACILRFAKTRRRYTGWYDWLMACYNRVLLRVSGPLPGRRSTVQIGLVGIPKPFLARLGTSDLHVLEEIYFHNEYDSVAAGMMHPVKLIVDLGANVGYSLRYWHERFPEARMIAVEPDADNAKLCRANVEAGGFAEQVEIIEACIGARERIARLATDQGEWAFRMVESGADDTSGISVKTFPQILALVDGKSLIDLLKCDIEGAEAELFSNCANWIDRVRNLVVELHPPYDESAFLRDLHKAGADFRVMSRSKSAVRPVLFLSNQAATDLSNHG